MASIHTSQQHFYNLSAKFSQLLYRRTENERNIIENILNELNALDYRFPIVTINTKAVLLVNQLSNLIPPDDITLVKKCCNLISTLVTKQHVSIEGKTLIRTILWLVQSLKQNCNVDVLTTLETLLRTNSEQIYDILVNSELVAQLKAITSNENRLEVILLSVQCLEAACSERENRNDVQVLKAPQQHYECAEVFVHFLLQEPIFDNPLRNKLLIACLRGLQNVVMQEHDYRKKELELLLGICKTFMVYQLKDVVYLTPGKVMPSVMSIPEPIANKFPERKGGMVAKQRKQRKSRPFIKQSHENSSDCIINDVFQSISSKLKTSDSDFSENDMKIVGVGKALIIEGRVRQAALNLLYTLCKLSDKSVMFSYWSSFLPDAPLSNSHSLTNCILKDPSHRARMAASNVLQTLLGNAKHYLFHAEHGERTTPFTPFSVLLGSIIQQLHQCLCLALNETSIPVLIQVLKCIAALVEASPYHRLAKGLTRKLIRNVKVFINHKDSQIQVGALIVLSCILASEPSSSETRDALLINHRVDSSADITATSDLVEDIDYAEFSSSDDDDNVYDCDGVVGDTTLPWLINKCVVVFDANSSAIPLVKIECLKVIAAISQNYFDSLLKPYLPPVTKALEVAIGDKLHNVRFHAGHAIEFIAQAITQSEDAASKQSVIFWRTLLSGEAFISLIQSEKSEALRAIGCDCLGNIGERVFEQLPKEKQLLCITMLFAACRDEFACVQGSAIRALAISTLYPSLIDDSGFIMDVIDVIHRSMNDPNVSLRIRASWSLGNLSDALVTNQTNAVVIDEFTFDSLQELAQDAIKGCRDFDKIKPNAVRALGNFLQLLKDYEITPQSTQLVEDAVNMLMQCATTGNNMKLRWNACYSINNLLKCASLYTSQTSWLESVFHTLADLVISSKHFKVRISAALALAAPPQRDLYGGWFAFTWIALVKGLESSENMDDYNEYKHRDHLVDQICLSLGHLVVLMKDDDLSQLVDTFSESYLRAQVQKVYLRLLPEKTTIFFYAHKRLLEFNASLQREQFEVISNLRNVFKTDV